MNKSCVRRLPGSGHGGGCVCWAPRLAGKGRLQTPSYRSTAQQDRAVSGIIIGLSQEELGPFSEVVPLLPAQESSPSQGWECPSAPLPSHRRAAQKTLLAGDTSSHPPGERGCAETGRHTQRGRWAVHTTHTGMVSTTRGTHVGTLGDGNTVIPTTHIQMLRHVHTQIGRPQPSLSAPPLPVHLHTHTHTHTHMRAHIDRCIWGCMDTHRPAHHSSRPPSISLGWGQFCNPYGAQTQLGCP